MEQNAKAEKILEINASHPIYNKLKALYETDKDKVAEYGDILYSQALLIEGMAIENPELGLGQSLYSGYAASAGEVDVFLLFLHAGNVFLQRYIAAEAQE